MNNHTKLPWIFHRDPNNQWTIESPDSDDNQGGPVIVELTEDRPLDEQIANAEFIVRACNCHEELVEALSVLLVDYENILYSEFGTENNKEPYRTPEWQKAKQALAKATK